MIRLTWSQPEDLVAHGLAAALVDGVDVEDIRTRWVDAGGSLQAPASGASADSAGSAQRALARALLDELDGVPLPAALTASEPDDLDAIRSLASPGRLVDSGTARPDPDRVHGAWLGRAAGCLLGKPVEKLPRAGIRELAQATGNWPLRGYFTEQGLPEEVAARWPWNRRSRPTSLAENIDGMPEDDDLNFPIIALDLLERVGPDFTTDDVALSWLANLPGGRVFTAERVVYRNLLDGVEPVHAGGVRNPFREWIGAQIRTDLYGWARPGDPVAAAELAWRDGILSHRRSGLYGAMFVAAASSVALVADQVDEVLDAGASVVPPDSRYAAAIEFGRRLGRSALDADAAYDELEARYGHLHWVHSLNNSALLSFALTRGRGDFAASITTAVAGGWDTDSVGATVGALTGALTGAPDLPTAWVAPLRNRLATSIPGFDGVGFDELARRTVAVAA